MTAASVPLNEAAMERALDGVARESVLTLRFAAIVSIMPIIESSNHRIIESSNHRIIESIIESSVWP
jgi:hypothetical protein